MAIALRYSNASTAYVSSGTSITVTIGAGVVAGDLLCIIYYARAVLSTPAGFTQAAEVFSGGFNQRIGLLYKIADGTESGTSITLTQASAARLEAFSCAFSSTGLLVPGIGYDQFTYTSAKSNYLYTTEGGAFLALAVSATAYTNAPYRTISSGGGSDVEFFDLNSNWGDLNYGRVYGFYGVYPSADTAVFESRVHESLGSVSHIGLMINFVESASATPTLSLPFASGITANSIIPNVTVTF